MYFSSLRAGLLALLVFLIPSYSLAATPGEQDLIRDRQDRLLEEQRRRLEDLKDLPGKQTLPMAPSAPADERCFPIQHIELKGAESLSIRERKQMLAAYEGQCLGVSQLNELLKVITNHYLDKGLVTTRAYLPQQDLSKDDLQVLVVEGKLENLQADATSGLSERELAMTFPGREGQLVNLREIEQKHVQRPVHGCERWFCQTGFAS